MYFPILIGLFAALPAYSLTAGVESPADGSCNDALDATVFSLFYGLPLTYFARFATPLLETYGSNSYKHNRELITPAFGDVVSPNEDTLYSTAAIDLSHHDLVFRVPDIDDGRFWVFALTDPYGNNFANIGSVGSDQPGNYLMRYAPEGGRQQPWFHRGEDSIYQRIIYAPTACASLAVRIYVTANNTADIDKIHSWQAEMSIEEADTAAQPRHLHHGPQQHAPVLSVDLLNVTNAFNSSVERDLGLLARLEYSNQPINQTDIWRVPSCLGMAGIHEGHYHPHPHPGISLIQASAMANATIAASASDPINILQLGNG